LIVLKLLMINLKVLYKKIFLVEINFYATPWCIQVSSTYVCSSTIFPYQIDQNSRNFTAQ
jgi:hypothetical protein